MPQKSGETLDIEKLSREHSALQSAVSRLETYTLQLEKENKILREALEASRHRQFGRSAETIAPGQLGLFTETPVATTAPAPLPPDPPKPASGHGRKPFPPHLPRTETVLDLPEAECRCATCNRQMVLIGEDVTERGQIVPAKLQVKRYVRKKYACPSGHGVKVAELPPALIDKCKYEPSVYAHVAVAKYGDHLPLHRQESIFKRHGFDLPKSTMWDMLVRLDEIAAQPILHQARKELLEERIVLADDTPVTLLLEDRTGSKQGRLWAYRSGRNKILFEFTETRGRDGPIRMLGDWRGTLQTDAYSGFDEVGRRNDLIRAGCWAHARRKLKEALDTGSTEAARVLVSIRRLFRIESALRKRRESRALDDQRFHVLRFKTRRRLTRRVLARIDGMIEQYLADPRVLPQSQFGKAVRYIRNQWEPLCRFVSDGELEATTNAVERVIRPIAVGRRNWMFVASPKGGAVAARLYSLVLMCKSLGINPEEYLTDVLQRVGTVPASEIASLTPWAWAESKGARIEAAAGTDDA